jgi:hypothetical protein
LGNEEEPRDQPADDGYPDQETGLAPDAADVTAAQLGELAEAGAPF